MKIIKNLLLVFVATFILSTHVNADDINILNMSKTEADKFIVDLIYASASEKPIYINEHAMLFESDCFYDISQFMSDNNINSSDVGDIVVDFTYPDNSSTGDAVIMANTKVWYDNHNYNKVYLFEFHINSSGRIYGFNLWEY